MSQIWEYRRIVLSICLLQLALLCAAYVGCPVNKESLSIDCEARLRTILPDADPLLLQRAAQNWGFTALTAAEQHGTDGLYVLEAFEDEAAYCLEHQPEAFSALAKVVRLDPSRFRLASGPWNRAVLDWAQSGKLDRFLDKLANLPPDKLRIAENYPDSLPILCLGNSERAKALIEKYGDRAWRLFMALNFMEHPEDLERVAIAAEQQPELMLRINETYGLPYALLLIPPTTDSGSRQLPEIVKHALRTLSDEATALALISVNYDSIKEMLDSGKTVRQIEEAVELFNALPPVVSELALDHTNTLRLLTETWHGKMLGPEVLRRCGPAASDLIYTHFSSDDRLKSTALVALAHLGGIAYQVFYQFRDYGTFHALLRRCEPEGLMDPRQNPPMIVHAVNAISREGQQKIDVYAEVQNLKAQVLHDARGPLPEEAYLEWLPGYIAYRTTSDFLRGHHVTGGDFVWALVDGVSTVLLLEGLIANGLKTTGRLLGREGFKFSLKQGLSSGKEKAATNAIVKAEKLLEKSITDFAFNSLQREKADLAHFGNRAKEIAKRRLVSRVEGVALDVRDRRDVYLELLKKGDINGKSRIIEEIGEEGARKYAEYVGYEPIFSGNAGKGRGFDQVYRDGDRIVALEAKGGGSPTKTYYGFEQGSVSYIKKVAEETLQSQFASPEEKKAAEEVLKAAAENRLFVEVVRTEHVLGKPGLTRVEGVSGPSGPVHITVMEELRETISKTPGISRSIIQNLNAFSNDLDLPPWIMQGAKLSDRIGIRFWVDNVGPLAPRHVIRKGQRMVVPPSLKQPTGQVSNLAIAIMERGMQ